MGKADRSRAVREPLKATGVVALAALIAGATLLVQRPSAFARAPANAPAPVYFGVNLASGSFASKKLPGIHGKDYIYPTRKIAEPFRAMGMNTVRLPALWERLQPRPYGELRKSELKLLDKTIAELDGFGTIILDIHNYGRFRGKELDASTAPILADLWRKLAERYQSNPRIAFGLMNEPVKINAHLWRQMAEQSTAAIRATGARNLILVPGTRWTGGHSWHEGGANSNAAALSGFRDPGRNFVFEIHQYLDSDSSGTKGKCSSGNPGARRLAKLTEWLRQQRAKAILAEFGSAADPACLAALDGLLTHLRRNGDVWAGWTYWAGGDWWGDYPMSIQPVKGVQRPQAAVLAGHIASYRR